MAKKQEKKFKSRKLSSDKFLSDDELKELKHALASGWVAERDAVYLEMMLATGARPSELLELTRKDLIEATKSVHIWGLKHSDDREIPISADLFRRLKALSEASKDGRPFPISYEWIKKLWQYVRPNSRGIHCLRHTFALRLYRRTKDLKLVQLALGHKSIMNTMIYADFEYSQNEMRRLMGVK